MVNYLEKKEDLGVLGEVGALAHVGNRSFEEVGVVAHIGKEAETQFFFRIKEFWWGSGK